MQPTTRLHKLLQPTPLLIALALLLSLQLSSQPGITTGKLQSNLVDSLPEGKPTACEVEWNIRFLHYHPAAVIPRRMYMAACRTSTDRPRMFTSLALGQNLKPPKQDQTSGAIVEAHYDPTTGKLQQAGRIAHFPECVWMEGITASPDCGTVAALCRRRYADRDFDIDALSPHPSKDWMTQPKCAQLSMWLYEWPDGNIHSKPRKILLNKAVDYTWENGNSYLRLGNFDGPQGTYGIGFKSRVADPKGQCHEADTFLILDRKNYKVNPHRGYTWACGHGHTTFNRSAYNPYTRKYALMCTTDGSKARNTDKFSGFYLRLEDAPPREFGQTNNKSIHTKGGTGTLLPLADGGFLGVLVGAPGRISPVGYIPKRPPTAIGLVRFDPDGKRRGAIRWVKQDRNTYLSFPQLTRIGQNRYLLGYAEMKRLADKSDKDDRSYRIPHAYYMMEIDINGKQLTEARQLQGAGWGEQDELVSLGRGRIGWAFIPNPTLTANYERPDCNASQLQLNVYQASGMQPEDEQDPGTDPYPYQFSAVQGKQDLPRTLQLCKAGHLKGIEWRYGAIIDGIRGLCSGGGKTDSVGANSGKGPESFVCEGPDNFLQGVEVWHGATTGGAIERLRLMCADGTSSAIVGGWEQRGKLQQPPMQCPAGQAPIGFVGNQGGWLQMLGLVCKRQ